MPLLFFMIAAQQILRIPGRQPTAFLGDSNRHHLILLFVDVFQDRRRRQQRNLMLAASSTKQHANTNLLGHLKAILQVEAFSAQWTSYGNGLITLVTAGLHRFSSAFS